MLQFGEFHFGLSAILHDFGVVPSKDDHAIYVFRISEGHATEEDVLVAQWDLTDILFFYGSFKSINGVIRQFTVDIGLDFVETVRIQEILDFFRSRLDFQVCFTIEAFCFNVASSFDFTGLEENKICWNLFILENLNDLAYLHIFPFDLLFRFIRLH